MSKVIEENTILISVKRAMNGNSWHGLSEDDWKEVED